jgi:hypothetical protein
MHRVFKCKANQFKFIWEGFILGGTELQQQERKAVSVSELKRRREVLRVLRSVSTEAPNVEANKLPDGTLTREVTVAAGAPVSVTLSQEAFELLVRYYSAAAWKVARSDEAADVLELIETADKVAD